MKRHYQSVDLVLSALVAVHNGNLEEALETLVAAKDEPDFKDALEDMNTRQQELFDKDNADEKEKSENVGEDGVPDYRSFKVS